MKLRRITDSRKTYIIHLRYSPSNPAYWGQECNTSTPIYVQGQQETRLTTARLRVLVKEAII